MMQQTMKEYRAACAKVAGYEAVWPADVFIRRAMDWLGLQHKTLTIVRDVCEGATTWTIQFPEQDGPSIVFCCGESLADALESAVDSTLPAADAEGQP